MVTRETSILRGLSAIGLPSPEAVIRRLARLAELLENDAVQLGFLGPNEGKRVISRHLLEAAALVPHLMSEGPVADVGSGAGLPGLVLGALGRQMILIDGQARRAEFLAMAAAELEIVADVRHVRAEEAGRSELRDDVPSVVARALAEPAVALELCLPIVRPQGRLLLVATPDPAPDAMPSHRKDPEAREDAPTWAGSATDDAIAAPTSPSSDVAPGEMRALQEDGDPSRPGRLSQVAALLGGADVRWQELSVPGADGPRWVMMVDKRRPTPDRFPRRPGVPKRRPLGEGVASVH